MKTDTEVELEKGEQAVARGDARGSCLWGGPNLI